MIIIIIYCYINKPPIHHTKLYHVPNLYHAPKLAMIQYITVQYKTKALWYKHSTSISQYNTNQQLSINTFWPQIYTTTQLPGLTLGVDGQNSGIIGQAS